MTESCETCKWARPWPPKEILHGPFEGVEYPRVQCVRFPQAVVNSTIYWCGEYLAETGSRKAR